jgi:hypothetical protein
VAGPLGEDHEDGQGQRVRTVLDRHQITSSSNTLGRVVEI